VVSAYKLFGKSLWPALNEVLRVDKYILYDGLDALTKLCLPIEEYLKPLPSDGSKLSP
tara:strand:- start:27 stop:200 length:174 start_codon:yes stop_codon:yes gene_type:complete